MQIKLPVEFDVEVDYKDGLFVAKCKLLPNMMASNASFKLLQKDVSEKVQAHLLAHLKPDSLFHNN